MVLANGLQIQEFAGIANGKKIVVSAKNLKRIYDFD
jgi:hypothetical protein